MKGIAYLALSIVLFASMAACELVGADNESDVQEPRELVGTTWQLVAFEKADGTVIEVDPVSGDRVYYTLVFRSNCAGDNDNGCMKAMGHPNEGFFTYDIEETKSSLDLHFQGATQINTPPESKEAKFFAALKAATSYEIKGNRLRITYDGKALLFEAKESESDEAE